MRGSIHNDVESESTHEHIWQYLCESFHLNIAYIWLLLYHAYGLKPRHIWQHLWILDIFDHTIVKPLTWASGGYIWRHF